MKTILFSTLEEALYLHEKLIETFGGAPGVVDKGLLESALARPRSGYYDSLCQQGAALFQSLAKNHPFVDGNKRMAFALTVVFLDMNGAEIIVSTDEGERFLVEEIIKNNVGLDRITLWLEEHTKVEDFA